MYGTIDALPTGRGALDPAGLFEGLKGVPEAWGCASFEGAQVILWINGRLGFVENASPECQEYVNRTQLDE